MQANYDAKKLKLEAEVYELKNKLQFDQDSKTISNDLDYTFADSLENLNSLKKVIRQMV